MNVDAWLSGEEGTRVVEAMRAERARHIYHANVDQCECGARRIGGWVAHEKHVETEVLRAALSLTTTCATCDDAGRIYHEGTPGPILRGLGYPADYEDGEWQPCPDCKGGTVPGSPLLIPNTRSATMETK